MEVEQLLQFVRNALEQISIRYLVTGSMATIAYGEPHFTNDIDIVVELKPSQIDSFCKLFPLRNSMSVSQPSREQSLRGEEQLPNFSNLRQPPALPYEQIVFEK